MNECVNYRLPDYCPINRARIVTEAARQLNGWVIGSLPDPEEG